MRLYSVIRRSAAATTVFLALAGCPAQDAGDSAPDLDALSPPPATDATDTNPAASAKLTEFDHMLIALANGDSLESAITGSSDTPVFISSENVTDRPEILVVDSQLYVNGKWVGDTSTPPEDPAAPPAGAPPVEALDEPPPITLTTFPPFDEPPPIGTQREVSAPESAHGVPVSPVSGSLIFAGVSVEGAPVAIGLRESGWIQTPQIPLPGCIADEQFPVSYTDDVGTIRLGSPDATDEPGEGEAYRARARVRSAEYVAGGVQMRLQLEMSYRINRCRWNAIGEHFLNATWTSNEMRYEGVTHWAIVIDGRPDLTNIFHSETRTAILRRAR